jgi:nucleotide-binding universal stress UspA family protein
MPGIIVGVDGSDRCLPALDWAIREAAIRQAPLTVFTVGHASASSWGAPVPNDPDVAEQAREEAERETGNALEQSGDAPWPPSITVTAVTGVRPGDALLEAAEDADLLVVGARGGGGFRRLRMGSVCTQVTQHACCPIVVIPTDDA